MEAQKWLSYDELAWTETILAPPGDYKEETERYCQAIKMHSQVDAKTLLHLGSGAGINDFTFKDHFQVTGVDLSEGMLTVARELNPEVQYIQGDMRTVDLKKSFDAVVVPEAINYMVTEEDAHKVILTACKHLKPGGIFLFTVHLKEEFQENNFVYSGARDDVKITVFENNAIVDPTKSTYEATIIYLIRKNGELKIYTDRHILGLISLDVWMKLLETAGFSVTTASLDHTYDSYLSGEGEYPLKQFFCLKHKD
jgi:SAM-dependent methyltransferase